MLAADQTRVARTTSPGTLDEYSSSSIPLPHQEFIHPQEYTSPSGTSQGQEEIEGMVGREGRENGRTVMRCNSDTQHLLNNHMEGLSI